MAGRMENKVVIVTGGGSGIGRATCYRLRQEGAKVVVADRNQAGAEETRELMEGNDQNSAVSRVDISRSSQVEQMVEDTVSKFGRLDGLVNGAAILIRTPPLVDVEDVDWDLTMDTNLKGTFYCCKYAIPAMLEHGGGSIVNISSMSGVRGVAYSVPYAVSKAGVIHLTKVAAAQYTHLGVRVNCIAPGGIDTPQMRGSTASAETFQERNVEHPMGRVGRPDEVANLITWLTSEEASYVSGSTYIIDGGAWALAT
ncbi:MAG TPA: SDR family oxidoreductase [Dehalococcoidia bacterium]|nr:SDR family oxidoreductase [Dehalococcoidia bacterium]MEE2927544.1 SDR family NAD(P)-dependent oxidoreductase [Chloroflexota bacterium]HIB10969.1 SDR family oxidoreductase [Dehalococcoidia bacterium]HIM48192.1 SDR family oxidoreductase [Dehalococcoidia bacterium]